MNEIGLHITNAIETGRVKNPADIARKLSVQRSTVSRWMSGEKAPSAEEARALAELIGAPEGLIMAECEAARAKDDATRAAWLRVARLCSRSAESLTSSALTLLVVVSLFVSAPGNALAAQAVQGVQEPVIPIMAFLDASPDRSKILDPPHLPYPG